MLHEVEATLRALHQLLGVFDGAQLRVPIDGVVLSGPASPDASTGLNGPELREVVLSKFRPLRGTNVNLVPLSRNSALQQADWTWLLRGDVEANASSRDP